MASLKDIAKKTGLSINTVSRAIRKQGYVSSSAMEQVKKAAAELGYAPNRAARSLRFRKNFEVAVIINNSISEPMQMEKLVGMKNKLAATDYELRLHFVHYENEDIGYYNDFINTVLDEKPAAVAILGDGEYCLKMADLCKEKNVPPVLMSYSEIDNYDCVYIDRSQGVFDAVNYLASKGHKKIAFAGPMTCRNRLRGYKEAIKANNLTELFIPIAFQRGGLDWIYQACVDKITEELENDFSADAVHCYSDYVAAGIMAGIQKNGLKVPQDIAVTGFDNRDFAMFTTPRLTTMDQQNEKAGELIIDLLLNRIEGKFPDKSMAVKVPMSLKIRDSA